MLEGGSDMKTYRVIFVPSEPSYEYLVEANDEAEAENIGLEILQEDMVGFFDCGEIKEESE